MDLQNVGCGGMDWIELAQDRVRWWALVSLVMKLWFPQNARNSTRCVPVSFSRRTLLHGVSDMPVTVYVRMVYKCVICISINIYIIIYNCIS